uniref:Putative quinone-oxidoreductase homologic n=1 Tax=Rhizophora mucronata TaxID=61149 RepID=A0A2P2ISD5_RHIMU
MYIWSLAGHILRSSSTGPATSFSSGFLLFPKRRWFFWRWRASLCMRFATTVTVEGQLV